MATAVELAVLPTKRAYNALPPRPDGVYDLFVDGRLAHQGSVQGGRVLHIDMATGASSLADGEAQTLRFSGLPAEGKIVELWLPHDEVTELVSLRSDAALFPVAASGKRRWVHHGSSISQGSNTTHPSGTWPAVAAMRAGLDLLNLGYGGNALLDPFVARTIRDLPADLISVKIGINLVNKDLMRLRAFGPAVHGFLDTIREGHPDTPLLLVSPVFCPIHEAMPGPSTYDLEALAEGRLSFKAGGSADEVRQGKLTLGVIREQLRAIVEQRAAGGDAAIRYVDGLELYGPNDNLRLPLPDELHPDAASHRLIGERFAGLVR
jgi:lysophospholipase L1-like esterase